jgi:hypothetical protein
MTIMVMELAHLYLKIVTTDTTTMTDTIAMTTMTEILIQKIMLPMRNAVTAQTRVAVLSPHVLSLIPHALIPHVPHALQALRDQEAPRVIPAVRVPRETSVITALRVLPDR